MTNKKDFPTLHPRHSIRQKAKAELLESFHDIVEEYGITFGEGVVLIAELLRHEAYGLRKVEDEIRDKENDETPDWVQCGFSD